MKQIAAPLRVLALLVSAIVGTTSVAHAQTYSLLQWIDTQEEGYNPYGALILASDGNLYGTMQNGGAGFDGTVFRITPAGALTTIHTFGATTSTVGYRPQAGVVEGADGNLYGMTGEGGTYGEGVIFRMTKAGVATPLYALRLSTTTPSGALASLVLASDGNFYGIGSAWDGTYFGKVFRMTADGAVTVLHRFSGADGAYPASSGLIQGSDGFLYGTTEGGGAADAGTIFKISLAGVLTTVHSFDGTTAAKPRHGLIQGTDGNFYGGTAQATLAGGGSAPATIFKMTSGGMVSTLYTFPGTQLDGREPTGRLRHASDGKLYGASRVGGGGFSRGTLFVLTTAGAFTKLHGFPLDDAAQPAGNLVETGGALYGMAIGTGNFDGGFFRLSGQSAPPVTRAETYTHTAPTGPSLTVAAPGVLGNDFGNGGGAMTAAVEAGVGHGTLTFAPNGAFTYAPAPGFTGVDTFSYRATNGNGASAATTVTIRVMLPPVVVNDAYTVASPDTLTVAEPGVLNNDHFNGAPFINASAVNTVAHGSLTLFISGRFVYTPQAGFVGIDSFTYQGASEGGTSNLATVTITVTASTGPPTPGPTPPGPPPEAQPPTGLTVDAVAGQLVTVRFTAPAAGLPPLGYLLKGGVVPGQVLAALATGSTAPIFSFVAPLGSFLVRVHTQTGAGESGPSNEVPLHVGVAVPPSSPTALTAMVNGSSVALSWKNTFGGGPPASMFLDVAGSQNVSLPLGLSETFTYPAVPGGSYTFRVRAANGGGTSAPSNTATAGFPGVCSGIPLPPARFLAYRVGTTLNVAWDPPATGAAPTHYLLQVTGAFSGTFPIPARSVSAPVGPGTYGLSVRAVNDCGSSAFTAEQMVAVP